MVWLHWPRHRLKPMELGSMIMYETIPTPMQISIGSVHFLSVMVSVSDSVNADLNTYKSSCQRHLRTTRTSQPLPLCCRICCVHLHRRVCPWTDDTPRNTKPPTRAHWSPSSSHRSARICNAPIKKTSERWKVKQANRDWLPIRNCNVDEHLINILRSKVFHFSDSLDSLREMSVNPSEVGLNQISEYLENS